ncbi:hypothetical protein ACIQUC_15745 [Curtobacterium sp. NPDC098951]|uniref:hypothetical protein n=1 Tax=Curtobacterium sp. NPDC098951 TaxID=3363974 RepID=UPI00380D2269
MATQRHEQLIDVLLIVGVVLASGLTVIGGIVLAVVAWKHFHRTGRMLFLIAALAFGIPLLQFSVASGFSGLMTIFHTIS